MLFNLWPAGILTPLPQQWLKLLPPTSGAETATTQTQRNSKYCECFGVACGINVSCRGRVNRCLEVATADKTANLVMHISVQNDHSAVSPCTNMAYRYANTFPQHLHKLCVVCGYVLFSPPCALFIYFCVLEKQPHQPSICSIWLRGLRQEVGNPERSPSEVQEHFREENELFLKS